jgi:hypothetical protein
MIFTPNISTAMWDTSLYYHEGKHYLFFLSNSRTDKPWDSVCVAVSDDGVHFVDHGPILRKADDATWVGAGMVWRDGDRFMTNFSESRNEIQQIFFADSTDLLTWRRLPDEEYVCRSSSEWYSDGIVSSDQRWDGIWVLERDDQPGYIGYVTAIAREGLAGLRGTAGCVLSEDGRHFRAAPPVIEPGNWGDRVEVGAVEKIGDKYYMLLGQAEIPLGMRHTLHHPAASGGMYVLVADRQTGPFRPDPRQDPLLVSSPDHYTYFARFYRCGDELLLNHHSIAHIGAIANITAKLGTYFAPLKAVHRDPEGLLSLHWWSGNQALFGLQQPVMLENYSSVGLDPIDKPIQNSTLQIGSHGGGLAVLPVRYDFSHGTILEADLTLRAYSDASSDTISGVGLFVEGSASYQGTLLIAESNNQFTVGSYNGYAFKGEDSKPLPFVPGQTMRWRLLVRHEFLELYVNDTFIQCYTLAHEPGGRLGFAVEAGTAAIANVQACRMSL